MNRAPLTFVLLLAIASTAACKKDEPAPAKAAAAVTSAKPASAAAKPAELPKGKVVPAAAKHPVPADWTALVDEKRGYAFSVPSGSTGHYEEKHGIGAYVGILPAPNDKVIVNAFSYKDAKRTLDDLVKDATDTVEKFYEETDVTVVKTTEIDGAFRMVELTSKDGADKSPSRWRILLATDVTDNYILAVGCPEADFKANEATIDEVWGSFDMFSEH